MRGFVTTTAVLCAAVLCVVCAASGPSITCCLTVSNTRIRRSRIVRYSLQTAGLCPINAVKFQTCSGKTLCSDPEQWWTRQTMKWLDGRQEKNEETSKATALPKCEQGKLKRKGSGDQKRGRKNNKEGKRKANEKG